jgi:DNA-directed RNA polymerase specialized sigma subunit
MKQKQYLSNTNLYAQAVLSKDLGVPTDELIKMWILLVARILWKLRYRDEMDREDCSQSALEDLLRYWHNFNPDKYHNAFAYFSTIAKNGAAKGFNKIHNKNDPGTVLFSNIETTNGNNNTASKQMELPF